jgi:hypothetical protein
MNVRTKYSSIVHTLCPMILVIYLLHCIVLSLHLIMYAVSYTLISP